MTPWRISPDQTLPPNCWTGEYKNPDPLTDAVSTRENVSKVHTFHGVGARGGWEFFCGQMWMLGGRRGIRPQQHSNPKTEETCLCAKRCRHWQETISRRSQQGPLFMQVILGGLVSDWNQHDSISSCKLSWVSEMLESIHKHKRVSHVTGAFLH